MKIREVASTAGSFSAEWDRKVTVSKDLAGKDRGPFEETIPIFSRWNWINRWQNSWRQSLVTQGTSQIPPTELPGDVAYRKAVLCNIMVTQWAGWPENYEFDSHRSFVIARRPTQRLTQSTNGGSFHQDTAAWIAKENHSPAHSTEVKNAWSYASTPPYLLVAWRLSKHRVT
jgi:hypothetical protein